MRVGFVGELGYEIHVPAGAARRTWRALMDEGKAMQLRPFGVEAQRILRLEKGHFIVSQDTDGLTDPFEANASWAVALGKRFFVGQRSLKILQARGPRQKLVGIEFQRAEPFPRESQLVIEGGQIAGRITSVAYSRTLGRTIGLALIKPELALPGRELAIRGDAGVMLSVRVVPTPFYDPEQRRQRGEPIEPARRMAVPA
jgi:sarcosine oxidase subunit alpha